MDPLTHPLMGANLAATRLGEKTRLAAPALLIALPLPQESPEWRAARRDPSIRGFMTWVRFPWYEVGRSPAATRIHIYDARRAAGGNPRGAARHCNASSQVTAPMRSIVRRRG